MRIAIVLLSFFTTIAAYTNDHHHYQRCFFGSNGKENICFFNMPKNATTFLRKTLFKDRFDQLMYEQVVKNHSDFIKIACFRDPLYRPISMYNEVLKLRKGRGPESSRKTKSMRFYKLRHNPRLSFKTFLDEITDNFYETHINHQHLALEKCKVQLEDLDVIFLCETLFDDLQLYKKKHKIKPFTSELYASPQNLKECLKSYIDENPKIQQKIRTLWAKDFKLYEAAKIQKKVLLAKMS